MHYTQADLSLFPPVPVQRRQTGWWSRNWKWVFALMLLVVLAVVVFFTTVVSISVIYTLRSSGALHAAVEQAGEMPVVVQRLGTPISLNGFPSGTFSLEQSEGFADMIIPIEGPTGQGKLYATGEKTAGQWVFTSMTLELRGESLPLLQTGSDGY